MIGTIGDICRRFWLKMQEDDLLLLASGMAFNILLCLVPVLLLWTYVLGLWFQSANGFHYIDQILKTAFPEEPYARAIRDMISSILQDILAHGKSFSFLSFIVLMATSASLFSSMRSVLHKVFNIETNRHFAVSYLIDLALVLGLILLFGAIVSLSILYQAFAHFRHLLPDRNYWAWGTATDLASLPIILLLCYLLYRYVPAERIARRTALISATATTLVWEISAHIFALYLGHFTNLSKLYGAYAFIFVLMIWIFYSSMIFAMGAELGQVLQSDAQRHTPPSS